MKKGAGRGAVLRRRIVALAVASCFVSGVVRANPTGPTVTSGSASFQQSGSVLQITNTPNAIINWRSFSIDRGEITRFIQQSPTSAVLNRVTGGNPSTILGTLQSNGRVFLINPNGILFGAGAQVNVSGLVASTLNISDADFTSGRLRFFAAEGAGNVTNQGTIRSNGGQIVLLAPNVTNSGVIHTPKGEVILAAGRSVELVDTQNPDLRVQITAPDNQVVNLGRIVAEAGRVSIYGTAIKNSGTISANSAVRGENGEILLKAKKDVTLEAESVITASGPSAGKITIQAEGGSARVGGRVEANASETTGGTIAIQAQRDVTVDAQTIITANGTSGGRVTIQSTQGTTRVAGRVEARAIPVAVAPTAPSGLDGEEQGGGAGTGGTVQILGEQVALVDNAVIDASGPAGGGTILIGGDYQGSNPLVQNARNTYLGPAASLNVDATILGGGGKVIVWADQVTESHGTITARGGLEGGDGGFVETSGKLYLLVTRAPEIAARRRGYRGGTWLLDPETINIAAATDANITLVSPFQPAAPGTSTLNVVTLNAALDAGGTVIVDTTGGVSGTGDINVNAAVTKTSAAAATLELRAHNNVNVNNAITSSSGQLNVTLTADQDNSGVGAVAIGALINTQGGAVSITSGGNVALSAAGQIQAGAGNVSVTVRNAGASLVTTAGSQINSNSGIVLQADDMTLGGTVSAPGSPVLLRPNATNRSINIEGGVSGGVLSLQPSELQNITAGTLAIGRPGDTGTLSVNAFLDTTNVNATTLVLQHQNVNVNASIGSSATPFQHDLVIAAGDAPAENITFGTSASVVLGAHNLLLQAAGDVILKSTDGNGGSCCSGITALTAAGNIDVIASAGAIFQTDDQAVNLTGANLTLRAGTSISPVGSFTATAGNVSLIAGTTLTTSTISASNNVTLTAPGAIVTGAVTATSGSISISSTGASVVTGALNAGTMITASGVTGLSMGTLTTANGVITLTNTGAGSDVTLNADVQASNAALAAGQPAISVMSGRDIILGTGTDLTANTSGGIRLQAASSVNLKFTDGNGGSCCSGITTLNAPLGNIDVIAAAGIFRGDDERVNLTAQNLTLTAGGAISPLGLLTSTAGNVTLTAGTTLDTSGFTVLANQNAVLTGGGAVTVSNVTATNGFIDIESTTLGVSTGTLTARTNIEVSGVTGLTLGILTSGNAGGSGTITLLNTGAGSDVTLNADVQASNAALAAGQPAISVMSGRDIILGTGTDLTANTSGGIRLQAASSVDLKFTDGNGGSCCSGTTALTAAGNIDVIASVGQIVRGDDQAVNLTAQNVTLAAGANIGAFGLLTATTGNVSLIAGSTLATSTISASNNVTLSAPGAITTGAITTTSGDISITSTGLNVNPGVLNAGRNISINAVTGITTTTLTSGTAGNGVIALTNTGAGSDVTLNGDVQASNAALAAGQPAISVMSGRDIILGTGTDLTANTSGGIRLQAASSVNLKFTDGNGGSCCSGITTLNAPLGNIDVIAAAGIFRGDDERVNLTAQNLTLTAGGAISPLGLLTSTAGNVTLTAGTTLDTSGFTVLANQNAVLTGGGAVTVSNVTATNGFIDIESTTLGVSTGTLTARTNIEVSGVTGLTLGILTSGNAGGSGTITLLNTGAGSDVTLNADVQASNAALAAGQPAISVMSGRDIILGTGTDLTANTSGGIRLQAASSVDLKFTDGNGGSCCSGTTALTAVGNIDVIASAGAIFRGDDQAVNLTARNVMLVAGANIGALGTLTATAGNVLLTAGTTLATSTVNASNDVMLTASGAVTTGTVTTTSGDISITSTGLNVNPGVLNAGRNISINAVTGITTTTLTSGTAGNGVIALTNTGAGSDVTLNGDVQASNAALAAGQPAISVMSGRDILLGTSTDLTANTSGGIRLQAASSVNLKFTDGNGGSCCSGTTALTAAGNIDILASAAIFRSDDQAVSLTGANLTFNAGTSIGPVGNLTATGAGNNVTLTAGTTISTSGITVIAPNDVTLVADGMSLGAVTATSGTALLQPFSTSRNINIESSATGGVLSLSPGTIQNISAGTAVEIGRTGDSGTLTVAAGLTSTNLNAPVLRLRHPNIAVNQPINFSGANENLFLATPGGQAAIAADLNVGTGTVNATAAWLDFSGTRSVTASDFLGGRVSLGSSIGTLNVVGKLTLNSGSVVDMKLAGTSGGQFDVINVSGLGTLDGTLNLVRSGAYVPAASESFQLINYGSRTGTFATVNPPFGVSSVTPSYNPGNLTVTNSTVLQINQWASDSGGDWDTGPWTLGVPTAGQAVLIDRPGGSPTVSITTGAKTVAQLYTSETLNVSAASDSLTTTGRLDLIGGTLAGSGAVTVNGTLNWTGGTMSGSGTTTVGAGGVLTIGGAANKLLEAPRVFTNNSTAGSTWSGTGNITAQAAGGATFNNAGFLEIQNDATDTLVTFNNSGTLTKTAGVGTTTFGVGFNNSGVVNVNSGTINLAGGGSDSGAFNVASGSVVTFTGGTHNLNAGASASGAGKLSVIGGAVSVNGGAVAVSNMDVAGGTLQGAGTLTASGVFNESSGTVTGANVTVNGTLNWTGGTMSGSGTTTVGAGGVLTIGGAANKLLEAPRVFTNNSTAGSTWSGTGNITAQAAGGATFNNAGFLEIQNDATDTLVTFNNSGTLTKTAGVGTTTFGVGFNNSGVVNVNSGTINLAGGGSDSGAFNVAGGSVLAFSGGTHNLNAGASASGAGKLSVIGGAVSVNGGAVAVSNMDVAGGTLQGAGTLTASGVFNESSGTVTGANVTVNGTLNWTGGTMSGSGTTTVGAGGVLTIGGAANKLLEAPRVFTNNSTAGSTWSGTGNITAQAAGGATFNNAGFLEIQNDATDTLVTFNNSGTLTKTAGVGTTTFGVGFNNSGVVNVNSGTINLAGGGSDSGAFNVAGGSVLAFSGGTHNLNAGASASGAGKLSVIGGAVSVNGGAVAVSNMDVAGGTLQGAGTLTASGVFNESSGTVTGANVTVNGTLNWTGGTMSGSGTTTVGAGGVLTIGGAANKLLEAPRVFTNNSTAGSTWSGTGNITAQAAGGATFNNAGFLEIQNDATDTLVTFNNSGTLTKTAGVGTTTFGVGFNNSGVVNVNSGTINLAGGGSDSGAFNVASGSVVTFTGGTHNLNAGASASGAGSLNLTGATVNVNAVVPVTNFNLSSGTLGGSGTLTSSGTFSESGGSISGANVTVNGTLNWTGGTMSGGGTTTVGAGGVLTISGAANKLLEAPRVFTNNSTAGSTWSGTGNITAQAAGGATFNNAGFLEIQNDATDTLVTFNNSGMLTKTAGVGTTTFGVGFNNSGVVNVNSGTINLAGGGSDSGAFNVAGGSVLAFSGGTHNLNAGASASGTGSLNLTGATVNVNAVVPVTNFNLSSGTLGGSGTLTSSGTFSESGGSISGANVTVNGTLNWTGGTMSGGGTTTVGAGGVLTISGAANKLLEAPRVFTNNSTAGSTWSGTGNITAVAAAGATFNNAGLLEIQNDASETHATFNNSGTLVKTGGVGTTTFNTSSGTFNNSGTLLPQSGTLSFAGGLNLTATSVIDIEIAGTASGQFDRLNVGGTANLAGTLNLNNRFPYVPAPGDSVQPITYGNHSGTFATVNQPFGAPVNVIYNAGDITLATANYSPVNQWVNPAGGNWGTAPGAASVDWSLGHVPTASESVLIDQPGLITVTVSTGSQAVGQLTSQENLTVNAGSLTFSGTTPSAINATLLINGGAVAVNSALTVNSLDLSSGSLSGTGAVTVPGTFTWSGGVVSGSGAFTTPVSSVTTLSTTNPVLTGRTWTSLGAVTQAAGSRLNLQSAAVVDIESGSSWTLTTADTNPFNYNSGAVATVNVKAGAVLNKDANATQTINSVFTNAGTVNVNAGTLSLTGSGTYDGRFDVDSGAALALTSSTQTFNSGSSVIGAGTLAVGGATANFNAGSNPGIAATGTVTLGSGTLNFSSGGTLTLTNGFTLSGGTLSGTDALVLPAFTWSGGVVSGSGAFTTPVSSVTTLSTTNPVLTGRTWTSQGAVTQAAGSRLNLQSAAVVDIESGSNWTLTTADTNPFNYNSGAVATVNVKSGAVLNKDANATQTINSVFTNAGTVNVNAGTLSLTGSGTYDGRFDVDSGAALALTSSTQTFNSGSSVIGAGTLAVGGATANFNAGSNPGIAATGTVTLGSGTLNFSSGGTLTLTNGFTLSGGTLSGTDALVLPAFTWSGGVVSGSGAFTTPVSSVTTLSTTNPVLTGRTWTSLGAVTQASGSRLNLQSAAVVDIESGSSWTLTTADTNPFNYNSGAVATVNVKAGAVLNKDANATQTINSVFTNAGTVNVNAGTLSLTGSGTYDGRFDVDSGAALALTSSTQTFNSGSSVIGAGTLAVGGATANFNAGSNPGIAATGTVTLGSGTLNFSSGGTLTLTNGFTLSGGTLSGTDALVLPAFTWSGGVVSGSGAFTTPVSSVTTLSTTNPVLTGRTWTSQGAVTQAAGSRLNLQSAAVVDIESGSNWTLTTADTNPFNYNSGAVATVNVKSGAVLNKDANATQTINSVFTNAGTVNVNAGTLSLTGSGTYDGRFDVDSGAALALTSSTQTFNSGSSVIGAGTLAVGGATANFNAGSNPGIAATGTVTLGSGTLNFSSGGTLTLTNGFTLSGGTLSGTDALVLPAFTWSGGVVSGSGAFTTPVSSVTTLSTTNPVLTGRTWTSLGAVTQASGSRLNLQSAAVVDIESGSSWTLTTADTNPFNYNSGAVATVNVKAGATLNKDANATQTINSAFTNAGTVNVNAGILSLTGTFSTNSGLLSVANNATFQKSTGFTNTGTLQGSGTISVGTGVSALINQGTLRAGTSPGTITINGDLVLDGVNGSVTEIEIGGLTPGTQHDVINVTGQVRGGAGGVNNWGTLNVSHVSFTPTGGDTFTVMNYGSRTGDFTATSFPAAGYSTNAGTSNYILTFGVATINTWTGLTGDWEDFTKWSLGRVPLLGDNVVIPDVGAPGVSNIITVNAAGQVAKNITNAEDLRVLTGDLAFSQPSTSAGAVTVAGGTLNANASLTTHTLNVSLGTLTGGGNVTVSNAFNWSGGTVSGGGSFTTAGASTLNGAVKTLAGRTWTNTGNATWTAGSISLSGGAVINNQGTFTASLASFTDDFLGTGTFNNRSGALFSANAGGFDVSFNGPAATNAGTMSIANGRLNFTTFDNTGTINLGGAGVFEAFTGSTVNLNAGSTVTGTGEVRVAGGQLNVNAPLTLVSTQLLSLQGGALSANANLSAHTLDLTAGTVNGGANLTVTSAFNQSGGTINIGGDASITQAAGVLGLTNNITAANVTLTSSAGATQSGGAITAGGLRVTGLGAFNLTGSNHVTTLAAALAGAGSLTYNDADGVNIGTVLATTGLDLGAAAGNTVTINAGGNIAFNAGSLTAPGGVTLVATGSLVNGPGGGTQIDTSSGAGPINLSAGAIGAPGAARIGINRGTGTLSATATAPGGGIYLNQTVGDLNGNFTTNLNLGNLELATTNGNIDLATNPWSMSGANNIGFSAGGNILVGNLNLALPTGVLSFSGSGSTQFTGGAATVTGAVAINMPASIVSGAIVDFNGPTSLQGLSLTGGALGGSGLITLNGASSWTGGAIAGSGTLAIGPTGSLSTGGVLTTARPITNQGAISVNSGTLTLTSFPVNAGALIIASGATLATGNNDLTSTGTISGNGTLQLVNLGTTGKTLTNDGIVSPGASPGTLSILGDYVQGPLGQLTLEVEGTSAGVQFDVLNISGNATLAGTLNVLPSGVAPPEGQTFDVIRAVARSGTFATVNVPVARPMSANYLANGVEVIAGEPPVADALPPVVQAVVTQSLQQATTQITNTTQAVQDAQNTTSEATAAAADDGKGAGQEKKQKPALCR